MSSPITSFDGQYRFLSNFYPLRYPIVTGTPPVAYPTAEHAYQAAKSDDVGYRVEISQMPTPGLAKRAGQAVPLRADWERIKNDVMLDTLTRKFTSDDRLGLQLLLTGDSELVEGNTWNDTYWGVCRGFGQNWLGRLLMLVRDVIKARTISINANRNRCGACPGCITVTLTQRAVYAEIQPAGGGVNSQTVSMWNQILRDNPCTNR